MLLQTRSRVRKGSWDSRGHNVVFERSISCDIPVIFHCRSLFFIVLLRAHPVSLVQKHTQLSVKCYEALCERECWRLHVLYFFFSLLIQKKKFSASLCAASKPAPNVLLDEPAVGFSVSWSPTAFVMKIIAPEIKAAWHPGCSVGWAYLPRTEAVCPHHGGLGSVSACSLLLHVVPPLSPCFLTLFSCPVLQVKPFKRQ